MNLLDSLNGQQTLFRRIFTNLFGGLMILAAITGQVLAKPIKIVAFGDSLTAGYGLAIQDSFPVKLQKALTAKGFDVVTVNAGVSGDTSTSGLQRLDWAVGDDADIVIVELGANDALRGIDPAVTRKSLTSIVEKLLADRKKVVLAGMLAPPNLGKEYGQRFEAIFRELGALKGVTFYRFFLEGVAGQPALNQPDGLHPTAKGIDEIVKRVVPVIIPLMN